MARVGDDQGKETASEFDRDAGFSKDAGTELSSCTENQKISTNSSADAESVEEKQQSDGDCTQLQLLADLNERPGKEEYESRALTPPAVRHPTEQREVYPGRTSLKGESKEIDTLLPQSPRDHSADESPPEPEWNFWKLSFREKVCTIRSNITVEPMLFLFIVPTIISGLAVQNLNLEKACRVNLQFSDQVCDAIAHRSNASLYRPLEDQVHRLVANVVAWKTLVNSSIPAVLLLFLGAWTDRHGRRRPIMLMPFVGQMMGCLALLVCTFFFKEVPLEGTVVAETLPAFTGSISCMAMGVSTFMGERIPEESRTVRMGIANILFAIGVPMGFALSGVLYRSIGFYGVFCVSAVMYMFGFLYGYMYVHDLPREKTRRVEEPSSCCCLAFLKDLFDWRSVAGTFAVCTKRAPNYRRLRLTLLMAQVVFVFGPGTGDMAVFYMYTRLRYGWNEIDFSMFQTYSVVVHLAGTAISLGILSSWLKMDDSAIGMVGCASKVGANIMIGLATSTLMIYLASVVDVVNGAGHIVMKSIASKLVPADELGQLNSLIGALEAVLPAAFGPLYSKLYAATLDTLPGAPFLVGAGITLPAVIIFGVLAVFSRRDAKQKKKEKTIGLSGSIDAVNLTGVSEFR